MELFSHLKPGTILHACSVPPSPATGDQAGDGSDTVEEASNALDQLTVADEGTKPAEDRLSTLIPDMLEYIFDLLRDEKFTKSPICKALLPYQRARLYQRVAISDKTVCQQFLHTIKAHPQLGSLVKVALLPDYRKMKISAEDFLLLVSSFTTQCLRQHLQTVHCLSVALDVQALHLDPLHHTSLLPNLDTLLVRFEKQKSAAHKASLPSVKSFVQLPSVKMILAGPSLADPEVIKLISRCPNIKMLSLRAGRQDVRPLLLSIPTGLQQLVVGIHRDSLFAELSAGESIGGSWSLGREMLRFSKLSSLIIESNILNESSWPALLSLPLEHLAFLGEARPNLHALLNLVKSTSTLRLLEISCFHGSRGRPIQPADLPALKATETAFTLGLADFPVEGWTMPRWNLYFPEPDVHHLIWWATTRGIEIGGTLESAVITGEILRHQITVADGTEDKMWSSIKNLNETQLGGRLSEAQLWDMLAETHWNMMKQFPPGIKLDCVGP